MGAITGKVALVELVERFFRVAGHYWRCYQLMRLTENLIRGSREESEERGYETDLSDLASRLVEHQGNVHGARNELLKIGRVLAVELERFGEDSTDLLRLLNAADGGGGPAAAGPLWQPLKATLQRVAIRAALPVARNPADGEQAATAPEADRQPEAFYTVTQLAELFRVPQAKREAFRRCVERKRLELGDRNWRESGDPQPNEARFTYRITPALNALAAKYQAR